MDHKIVIILIMGTPKKVPLILGNLHMTSRMPSSVLHVRICDSFQEPSFRVQGRGFRAATLW